MTDTMVWTPQQAEVLGKVAAWLEKEKRLPGYKNVFRLMGYAGTGKSTLARECVRGRNAVFAAFTGKAAKVMREKGCEGATTIHRLIYKPIARSKARLVELEDELAQLIDCDADERYKRADQEEQLREDIEAEKAALRTSRVGFTLNTESTARDADVIVIDEVSMVDRRIGEDLLSFGVPLLVLGDPAQLPPVFGEGFFVNGEPDAMLTDIRRQEAESPVIRIATTIRNGQYPSPGEYGPGGEGFGPSVVGRMFTMEEAMAFDQVIVGRNRTRRIVNREFRETMGRAGWWPEAGDRIICLRNDHKVGLLNGGQWVVRSASLPEETAPNGSTSAMVLSSGFLELTIEDEEGTVLTVDAHPEYFRGEEPDPWSVRDAQCFDYAYAITCHKAQGSQWDRVLVVDESRFFRGASKQWLYTATTRAAKEVAIMPG